MKVYLVEWGFYSSYEGGMELSAIYSTYDKALNHLETQERFDSLDPIRSKETGELLDKWTDGDYWIMITEAFVDSPVYTCSKTEWEQIINGQN